ncbi:MAG: protein translocase subunit SecD [Acidobacteriota bacterium]|nr:protein translocase subunit SecD [Acidobacteriota bacterium]
MKKGLKWKVILTVGVIALAVFLATPPKEKIRLGLDLRGGLHLVLQVVTDDALNIETDQEIARFQDLLTKKELPFGMITRTQPGELKVQDIDTDRLGQIRDLLDDDFRNWDYSVVGRTLTVSLKPQVKVQLRDMSVSQALETIRNRVDQFGVAEPTIQRQGLGGEGIIVELPGVDNPERVLDLIKTTALLEWKLVLAGPAADEESLLREYGGVVPDDAVVIRGDPRRRAEGYYLLSRVSTVTGKDLRNARRSVDEWNNPAVSFSLNADGARRFERTTGENIGKQLAIVLDGKVQSAPVINARISGEGIIQGTFTIEEAEDLSLVLRAGALPASINIAENRTIGPSLGADSVRRGLMASLVALLMVIIFMVVYYRQSGINAVVALVLNIILLAGALAYFKATLTLPGIAGIILVIGMAVDANVLIFERIREELTSGKSVPAAISLGFSRAFSAILDANVTTIIAAVFLFQFGTGPIKGYAVTLIIGITASMFTAVFVSHLIFDLTVTSKKNIKKMSI